MLDWLAHRSQISRQKAALVYRNQCWTYGELDTMVVAAASRLAVSGVQPGQRVAVLLPNRVEYVVLIHALARLGAVLVPLNVRLLADVLRRQLQQTQCSHLICGQETQPVAATLQDTVQRVLSVDPPREAGFEALSGFPAVDSPASQKITLDLGAAQGIVFTSGTTGYPKGAILTYANHLWAAAASAYRLGMYPADRWLLCMPLYHLGGLAIALRCCLYGTTVVLQDSFDPSAVSRALDTEAVTLISLVPTMLHRLLALRGDHPGSDSLRCILLGGAAAPPALLERCFALCLPVAVTYGLTEAASQVATASPADVRRKPGSVGKALMFSEIRIINAEGKDMPPGEVGEIVVRGPGVIEGYYGQPDATQKVLRNNQLHTGDMGYLDDEGDLWVMQRQADLILTGGENVYPAEVERALLEHPEVREACVVGVEDAEWGQRVAAAVVVGAGSSMAEDSLIAFCRDRVAGYKLPRRLRFVEALPRTDSGKLRRAAVRDLLTGRGRTFVC